MTFSRVPRDLVPGLRALALASAVLAASCGKKASPLPPLVHLPTAPTDVSARRSGDEVTIKFTVPVANITGMRPADIERVDVYGWVAPASGKEKAAADGARAGTAEGTTAGTSGGGGRGAEGAHPSEGSGGRGGSRGGGGTHTGGGSRAGGGRASGPGGAGANAITPEQIYKYAPVIGTAAVRRPPPPPPEQKEGQPPPPPPPPRTDPGLDQGALAQVSEKLTPELLEPLEIPHPKVKERREHDDEEKGGGSRLAPPDTTAPAADALTRYYLVVGVNHGNDRGTAATRLQVPTWPAPMPPGDPAANVIAGGVVITWTPPAKMRAPVGVPAPPPVPVAPAVPVAPGTVAPAGAPGAPAAPGTQPAVPATPPGDEDDEEQPRPGVQPSAAPAELPAQSATPPPAPAPAPAAAASAPATSTAVPTPAGQPPAAGQAPATAGQAPTAAQPGSAAPGAAAPGTALSAPAVAAVPAPPTLTAAGLLLSHLVYPWPASNTGFVVYEVAPPDLNPKTIPALPAAQPFPKLLTPAPVQDTTFTDTRLEFGATHCYVVRTIDTAGTGSVESESSAPVCVKPKDVFAPAAPKGLQAVASEGAVSLIWEANAETDLGGYLVLRAAAPSTDFKPLTPQPIKETTYRDTNVRRGVRYVYIVVAVDTATPSNRSEPSNRAEEVPR